MMNDTTTPAENFEENTAANAATSEKTAESPADAKPFQEAYQKMAQLKRISDQIARIEERKQALIEELRIAQSRLNEEITRVLVTNDDATMAALDDSSVTIESRRRRHREAA